ncbi:MAG: nucleotidyltransferase domain-containing protein [Chitinispirillales bacterium]|jgi:predicted nucleotidyltransferase|nr:nucleotidyltransferase domain-containing protein [Chitinispirillales bacterium]
MTGLSETEEKTVIDIISRVAPDCDVFMFGSRYLRTHKDHSDLDLAFALPQGAKLTLARLGEIKDAFCESNLVFRVDVVDYNGVEPYFREIIDGGCKRIYLSRFAK